MLPWVFLLCMLILLRWCILLWTNPFLLFLYSWVSQGLARLPRTFGFIFKTSRGVPRVLGWYRPILLWTPVWHFSSSPTAVSLDIRLAFLFKTFRGVAWVLGWYRPISLLDTRLAFLFKTYRGVTWHPTGISFILFYFPLTLLVYH
jgi:hypothetical protein